MAGDWRRTKIRDLADSISETHSFEKEELIFLNTSDIFQGQILQRKYSAVKNFPGQAKKSINGRYAYVDIDANDYCVSTKLMVIRARKDVRPKYLYYFLTSKQITDMLQHLAESRSGTFPQITFDQVALIELDLPPITIQGAISDFIDALSNKIVINRQMNRTLDAIAQAIFKHWFIDFEFPNEEGKPYKSSGGRMVDSELGKIPKGWNVFQIMDFGKVVCGKTPSTNDRQNYGHEVPFITIHDMRNQIFVLQTERMLSKKGSSTQENKELPPYSICVSCIATPGLAALTSEISQTNQQINSIICNKDVSSYFIYYSMKEKSNEIKTMGSGGTATLNLNKGNFEKIKIIAPSSSYMNTFHRIIDSMFNRILNNSKENMRLTQIRDPLLPQLMSGKIRVKPPKKEMVAQ